MPARGEGPTNLHRLQSDIGEGCNHSSTASLSDRQIASSSPSSVTRTPSPPASSAPIDLDAESFRVFQVTSNIDPTLPGRTDVVDPPAALMEQTGHHLPPSRRDNTVQCVTKRVGVVCNGQQTRDHWTVQEKKLHINSLELLAGTFAIKAFVKHQSNIQVLLRINNRSAVAYVNRMVGTHSLNLSLQACHLWQWCIQKNILLTAEHLPGTLNTTADLESIQMETSAEWMLQTAKQLPGTLNIVNIEADLESRQMKTSAEWILHKEVFQRIQCILGPCQVDLLGPGSAIIFQSSSVGNQTHLHKGQIPSRWIGS